MQEQIENPSRISQIYHDEHRSCNDADGRKQHRGLRHPLVLFNSKNRSRGGDNKPTGR